MFRIKGMSRVDSMLIALVLMTGVVRGAAATTISEFVVTTPGSQPNEATAGPDGNFWFTELNGNKIGMITPGGVVTEFPVPTPASQPSVITAGPDNALWFTEAAGNKIGRITTGGLITNEFPVPTPASTPEVIVTGPDGNLWFAEKSGNKIGRLIPASGHIDEFPVPTANSQPARLLAGADGNVWFVEQNSNKIGRVAPAGTVTEFTLATANPGLEQIINGPDGNFWFVEKTAGKIGRITPGGTPTEFPLPNANSQPTRIVSGRDNNLWFTESNNSKIGQITPAGQITEFPTLTGGSGPNRLNRGRDAALWFTENAANKIGRITYAGQVSEFPVVTPNTGFAEIRTSFDGNVWYVGSGGNVIGRIVDPAFNLATLNASVLPGSRSVQAGVPATAFATIINSGAATAQACEINDRLVSDPELFSYQTTDPATNVPTGLPNTPADIPAGKAQTFVFAMMPTGPFDPFEQRLNFSCSNGSASFIVGVNTLLLSGSSAPVLDVIALGATLSGDGILHVPGAAGQNAFAVATANVGASGTVVFSADTGGANLPLVINVCQTNPITGLCSSPIGPSVNVNIPAGATPTVAVFVQAVGPVVFDPANARIFGRFKDQNGIIRGETSVAVTTAF